MSFRKAVLCSDRRSDLTAQPDHRLVMEMLLRLTVNVA